MAETKTSSPSEELTPLEQISWLVEHLGRRAAAVGLGEEASKVWDLELHHGEVSEELVPRARVLLDVVRRVKEVDHPKSVAAFLLNTFPPHAGAHSLAELVALGQIPEQYRPEVGVASASLLEDFALPLAS